MSYCRFSTPNSDVYVFGSGGALECILAGEKAQLLDMEQEFIVKYDETDTPELTMVGHLHMLRREGVGVPQRAIDRLLDEAIRREDLRPRCSHGRKRVHMLPMPLPEGVDNLFDLSKDQILERVKSQERCPEWIEENDGKWYLNEHT